MIGGTGMVFASDPLGLFLTEFRFPHRAQEVWWVLPVAVAKAGGTNRGYGPEPWSYTYQVGWKQVVLKVDGDPWGTVVRLRIYPTNRWAPAWHARRLYNALLAELPAMTTKPIPQPPQMPDPG
jgi:hypothetical protein